jgi:hypothetical protein
MRTVIAMLALAALAVAPATAEPDGQDEAPDKRADAAATKARKALEGVEGVRAVSHAGVDGVYRLIVSVEAEEARQAVREKLGAEYEGLKVVVYTPAARATVWAKPKEPAPIEKPAAAVWPPKAKEPDVDVEAAAVRLKQLKDKVYDLGVEKVRMDELLDCDGLRVYFRLPELKRARGTKPCQLVLQLNFGFNLGANATRFIRHREACCFSAQDLIEALPKEIREDMAEYARLLKKK